MKHSYEETDIRVEVAGLSLTHTSVLKKEFKKGNLILSSGGPISSSPILFSKNENVEINFIEKKQNIKFFNQSNDPKVGIPNIVDNFKIFKKLDNF